MFSGFSACCQGYAHEVNQQPCQDAAGHWTNGSVAVCAVSDGHGGERYIRSGKGAEIATRVTVETFRNLTHYLSTSVIDLRKAKVIASTIITKWNVACHRHFMEYPLSEKEMRVCQLYGDKPKFYNSSYYGCTLIYGFVTEIFCLICQIGDGRCMLYTEFGNPAFAIEKDEAMICGMTYSLSSHDVLYKCKHLLLHQPIKDNFKGMIVCTDGVTDSYSDESLLKFGNAVINEFRKEKYEAKNQLLSWLPELSRKGSGDDMGIAGIYKNNEYYNLCVKHTTLPAINAI